MAAPIEDEKNFLVVVLVPSRTLTRRQTDPPWSAIVVYETTTSDTHHTVSDLLHTDSGLATCTMYGHVWSVHGLAMFTILIRVVAARGPVCSRRQSCRSIEPCMYVRTGLGFVLYIQLCSSSLATARDIQFFVQ